MLLGERRAPSRWQTILSRTTERQGCGLSAGPERGGTAAALVDSRTAERPAVEKTGKMGRDGALHGTSAFGLATRPQRERPHISFQTSQPLSSPWATSCCPGWGDVSSPSEVLTCGVLHVPPSGSASPLHGSGRGGIARLTGSGGPSSTTWHQRPPRTCSQPNWHMSDTVTTSSSLVSPATHASTWIGLCCIVHLLPAPEKCCANAVFNGFTPPDVVLAALQQ